MRGSNVPSSSKRGAEKGRAIASIPVQSISSSAHVAEHATSWCMHAQMYEQHQSEKEQTRAEQRAEQSHGMIVEAMLQSEHTIGGSGLLLLWRAGQGQG